MMENTAADRLGQSLAAAARRYGQDLRASQRAGLDTAEARSLLARFGLPAHLVDTAGTRSAPSTPQGLDGLARLRDEDRRLVRLARKASPLYSLNRHIAVRRLVAYLSPAAPGAGASRSLRTSASRLRPTRLLRCSKAPYSTKTRELAAAPAASITEMSMNPASSGVHEA